LNRKGEIKNEGTKRMRRMRRMRRICWYRRESLSATTPKLFWVSIDVPSRHGERIRCIRSIRLVRLDPPFLMPALWKRTATRASSRRVTLEEVDQGEIVQLLPSPRRRGHDDTSRAVLEDEPSACGTRQGPRGEMPRGPGMCEALLTKGPDMPASIANLTRRGETLIEF
jgi:hypothetical protein